MDAAMQIKDDHKRAFAIGFKFLFDQQEDMHQSAVASLAKVPPATITAVMRGHESRFPSLKAQSRISEVFGLDVYTVVEIGKKIQRGDSVDAAFYIKRKGVLPKHSDPDVQEFIDQFNFDRFSDDLSPLTIYEQQIIKICRSFEGDGEFMQDLYDFVCDLFVSYQARVLKKIKKDNKNVGKI